MFSKHIRNFIFVLILFFILILFSILIFFLILILTFIQGQTPPGMSKCVLGWCLPLDYQKLESPTPDEPVIDFIVFLNMLHYCHQVYHYYHQVHCHHFSFSSPAQTRIPTINYHNHRSLMLSLP